MIDQVLRFLVQQKKFSQIFLWTIFGGVYGTESLASIFSVGIWDRFLVSFLINI